MPPSPIDAWYRKQKWREFPFQREARNAYLEGRDGLVHSATGTGKTLAVWLGPLQEWLNENPVWTAKTSVPLRVLWITPLRALAQDTAAALAAPVAGLGLPWTVETRTGDTSSARKARQTKRLPTALVTTPESLTLLLTHPETRERFADLRCVVVDEWHELLAGKRGVQVELALARLRTWNPKLRTWGLSATLGNLDLALNVLTGTIRNRPEPASIRGLVSKRTIIDTVLPPIVERFPWAGHLGLSLLPQVIQIVEQGRSALVFTNTRSQTEQWYQALLKAKPDWAGRIALHHGSLDRKVRDFVENGLRSGLLRCVVCTSSLDLGVDFSPVDRVLQIGSPKGVARLLQRAGRSGHRPGCESRVTCVPTNALELVEIAAARDAAAAGRIEGRTPIRKPLDVLAQHLVTVALGGGFQSEELLAEVRQTHAYSDLSEVEWQWVIDFVVRGGDTLGAYPEYRRVEIDADGSLQVKSPLIARRHRMAIGTIVGEASVRVQYLRGGRLGTVEETFIDRLKPGDVFQFAGKLLSLVRVHDMTAWVRKAARAAGVVPRWMGGRMPLSNELAAAVRTKLEEASRGEFRGAEMKAVRPILELQAKRSAIPAATDLLVERLRSREGHHLFVYPFEGRFVHEGLAALMAYRLSKRKPITFSIAVNDYGFELLSREEPPFDGIAAEASFTTEGLADDLLASLNAAEMAKRSFREIARVAGLVHPGYPGQGKTAKQLQASSNLFYQVFAEYDPGNLLLHQARREVLEKQLEESRLRAALERLGRSRLLVEEPAKPTPLAFPLLVDRMRASLSSEKLADRVRKMQMELESAVD